MVNSAVLVLNRHYQPVHVTNVKRAFSLLYQGVARAIDEQYRLYDFSDWTERRLSGASVLVAFLVGGAINLPSPVYLLALGKIATGAHGPAGEAGLVLLFNAIMFGLVELPLLGYLLRPRETAARVAAFSTWLNANGIRVVGFVVVLFSVSLILQGLGAAI